MNDQCVVCKIRKWCYRDEPQEDWTCDYYKSDDDYVDFLDEDRPEEEKQNLIGYVLQSKQRVRRGDRMNEEEIIKVAREVLGYDDEEESEDDLDWLY